MLFLFVGSERIVKSALAAKHSSGPFVGADSLCKKNPEFVSLSKKISMQGVQDSDTTVYHVIDQTTASHLGPPRSSIELYASLVSYVFLAVASIFGNTLVIGAYVKNERLQRNIRYTFIIGLACADLLVGLVSLPIWIYITLSAHNDTPFHRTLYQVYITVDIFIGSASILQLAGISVERSYAVVRPVKHRLLNRKTLDHAVAVTWLFSAALASIQPLQYGTHWQMIYTMVMATLCFFIPTVVIITAYCCIFAAIKTKNTMANHRTNKNCFTKEVCILTSKIYGLWPWAMLKPSGLFLPSKDPFGLLHNILCICNGWRDWKTNSFSHKMSHPCVSDRNDRKND